jgi:fumarate hydratase subunit beta
MLMAIYKLKTPISEDDARKLRVNDVVYLSGTIVTVRDQGHSRALEWHKEGKALPVNLEGLAIFHCGPVMEKRGDKWVAIAAGPTTSTRMDVYEDEFIRAFKPRIVIGKGGMGKRTTDALAKYGCVYCAFTGGTAVLAANAIESVSGVEWLDLGMPEAMWIFEVEQFGPLVVAIDSHGRNLFMDIKEKAEANRQSIFEKLSL